MPLLLARLKALDPDDFDRDFWAEIRERAVEIARPLFADLFLLGAELGRSITPAKAGRKELLPVDPALINRRLDAVLESYVNEWWRGLQATTDRGLRDAIRRAAREGTGVAGVMKDIEPLFAPSRLQRIASTESTRLLGLGAQATYAASGLEEWEWQTVRDARVDPICQQLQGKRFPMETAFGPAHVSCRCYPKPVVPEGGVPAPARPPGRGALNAKNFYSRTLKLTPDEAATVDDYQRFGFSGLNHDLRAYPQLDSPAQRQAEILDDLIARSAPLPKGTILYRGAEFRDPADIANWKQPGLVLEDRAFVSTTLNETIAKEFQRGKGYLFEIHVPAGQRAALLPSSSKADIMGDEFEVLLARGSRFKVIRAVGKKIVLEIVP